MASEKPAVVIPGWNEAGNIPCFYLHLFPSLSAEMPVSVRNDNSTGGTVEFVGRTAVAHENRQPGV
jgi:hypothetical protein